MLIAKVLGAIAPIPKLDNTPSLAPITVEIFAGIPIAMAWFSFIDSSTWVVGTNSDNFPCVMPAISSASLDLSKN